MRELLIATTNKGKLPEILAALGDVPFKIITLADVDGGAEVEETADTLEGNAVIKATTYGRRTGLLTLAEDTGLEVDALHGEPGVKTARFAPGSDEDRYRFLLQKMHDVSAAEPGAQFRTVSAVYDPASDKLRTTEGACRGMITHEPKGNLSFGYSPVFYIPERGKTMAEMEIVERNEFSHRGKSIKGARQILLSEFV